MGAPLTIKAGSVIIPVTNQQGHTQEVSC